MSAVAVKWALSEKLPQTRKAVLVSYAREHSPRWGYSLKSQAAVAAELSIARETVNRHVRALVRDGLMKEGTLPGKKGQWDRRIYSFPMLDNKAKPARKRSHRVTQDHTAPCDSDQTRHRVTDDHTSRRDNCAEAPEDFRSKVSVFRVVGGYDV